MIARNSYTQRVWLMACIALCLLVLGTLGALVPHRAGAAELEMGVGLVVTEDDPELLGHLPQYEGRTMGRSTTSPESPIQEMPVADEQHTLVRVLHTWLRAARAFFAAYV